MAFGKFQGVMAAQTADRFLQHENAAIGCGRRNRLAVDALGFLGKPLDETGTVADFAAGFGQRLALFEGENRRQILGVLVDGVEPRLEQPAAPGRGERPPLRERRVCSGDRAASRLRPRSGIWPTISPFAGLRTGSVGPPLTHSPPMYAASLKRARSFSNSPISVFVRTASA